MVAEKKGRAIFCDVFKGKKSNGKSHFFFCMIKAQHLPSA